MWYAKEFVSLFANVVSMEFAEDMSCEAQSSIAQHPAVILAPNSSLSMTLSEKELELFDLIARALRHYKQEDATIVRVAGGWVRDKVCTCLLCLFVQVTKVCRSSWDCQIMILTLP